MQFDGNRRSELLEQLFGADAARWQSALVLAGLGVLLTLGLVLVAWLQPQPHDRLRRQLDRCLRRAGVPNRPGASLNGLIQEAEQRYPHLAADWQQLAEHYLATRFAPGPSSTEARRNWSRIQRRLLQSLKQNPPSSRPADLA
jgi:hypothetical protein